MTQFDITKMSRPAVLTDFRAREAAAIACAAVLWVALAWRSLAAVQWSAALPGALALAALLGVLAADLLSGIVHFACDRFFSERTPLIGRAFIAPFRDHHAEPSAIARHGVCERNGNNCIAVLPLLIAAHVAFAAAPAPLLASVQHVWLLALSAAILVTNEIHAAAHRERVPAAVRALQRTGVILAPEAHRLHHAADHARAYCITTGWLNPLLDAHAAFARVEAVLRRAGRVVRGRQTP